MSKQETDKQDEKEKLDGLPPIPNNYPSHYTDPAWLVLKVLAVIKKVLERRNPGVFTQD